MRERLNAKSPALDKKKLRPYQTLFAPARALKPTSGRRGSTNGFAKVHIQRHSLTNVAQFAHDPARLERHPSVKQHLVARRNRLDQRVASGFTLIEVMIVVAIIAILASIAIPSYNDYVRRGQLPEAFAQLSDYRTKMEQYYQDTRNYGSSTACADATSASTWNTFAPNGAKYFRYECATSNTAQNYQIKAIGISGQATGHTFTINQNGDRGTTAFKGATVTATCWLTRTSAC
jgi:type IV pilus assembly protein PilE